MNPETNTPTLEDLERDAYAKLREAERAWHAFWTATDEQPARAQRAEVFERIRRATHVA